MRLKELDASQRVYGTRIRSHCLAEIEGGNVEELGEFVWPVRLVRGAPPIENSWSCSGYACLYSATVNCLLLLPTPRHHRCYLLIIVPLPSMMYAVIAQSHQEGGLRPTLIAYSNSCHEMRLFHESGDDDLQPRGFCGTFATKPCCSERSANLWTGLQVKENHGMAWSRSNW